MAPEEESSFSFPPITNTPPRFFESPPLWRRRPSSTTNGRGRGRDRDAPKDDDEDLNEEKMDVLWEDLNEDNLRNRGLVSKSGISTGLNSKFGCLQSFNPPKGNGKRPSVVVYIKLLTKWLSLRNAHRRSVKNRPRSSFT